MTNSENIQSLVNQLSDDDKMRVDIEKLLESLIKFLSQKNDRQAVGSINKIFTIGRIRSYSSGLYPKYDVVDNYRSILDELENQHESSSSKSSYLYNNLLLALDFISSQRNEIAIQKPNKSNILFPSSSFEYKGNNDTRLLDDDSPYYSYVYEY